MPPKKNHDVPCAVDGCETAGRLTLSLCRKHYVRLSRYGTTDLTRKPAEQRFWAKVDKSGECWLWTGSKRNLRYGGFCADGTWFQVHRYSYEITHGPIPDGLVIDHKCRVYLCVNPDHLQAVTQRENSENLKRNTTHNKTSGVRGVTWFEQTGRWNAYATSHGKRRSAGYYDTVDEAEQAAMALRLRLHTNNLEDRKAMDRGKEEA